MSAHGRTDAVLLLGMHRSGTSVLARAMASLGLWIGDESELLPPHPVDNPEGYFERTDVHDAHVAYLRERGHDWDRLAGFSAADPGGVATDTLLHRLASSVRMLDRHRPWLLKDPRLSVLLPIWRRVVPDFAAVVAVRHPLEIAASLQSTPRGLYPTPFLLLLWQKYMARLLVDLEGRPVLFVDYRRALQAPERELLRLHRSLAELGVDGLTAPCPAVVSKLFDSGLYRRRIEAADADTALTPDQRRLLAWLQAAAASDGVVAASARDMSEPDRELREFEASFDQRLERGREQAAGIATERLGAIELGLREVTAELNKASVRFAAELAAERQAQAHLADRLVQDNRMLGVALSDLQGTRDALMLAKDELEALRARLPALQAHADNLEGSWSWRLTAPLRVLGRAVRPRVPMRFERWLYRTYYRLPWPSNDRKRRTVVWLHEHLPILTSGTQSYLLYRRAYGPSAGPGADVERRPRTDAESARAAIAALSRTPIFSILVPTFNTDPEWLRAAIDSVRTQYYPNWQLCIADDGSTRKDTLAVLAEIDDPRIRVVRCEGNKGIASASNAALALAEGDYVGLLDHDDLLSADALLQVASALQRDDLDIVYSDEDKIDGDGRHGDPHFKPGYSPDMLLSQNYICHFLVARRDLMLRAGGFAAGVDGAQDHDLLLRLTELSERIERIPLVLYHWRMHAGSTAADPGVKPASWRAGLVAVGEAMRRRGIQGRAEFGPYPHTYRVRRAIAGSPLVSVIIPFRDKPDLLETCVTSILARTEYENYEIVCVDNGSAEAATRAMIERLTRLDGRVRFLYHDVPFNYSAINNFAARKARGEHLLLLNNDTEVITPEWLGAMLEHSQRPEVGVVGARLLYGDGTVQHAGVIAGLGGVAGHAHLNMPADSPGYFCRMHLIQDLSAVTFACAMTRRSVFEQLGGLNEEQLRIAFNDVDYCFRAREAGYRVIYTPYALLHHYESKSRGYEDSPEKQARFTTEVRYMQERHSNLLITGDPFYNPNFPLDRESFAVELGYRNELP